jgi:hypothetical protein
MYSEKKWPYDKEAWDKTIEKSATGNKRDCPLQVKDENPPPLEGDTCSLLLQIFCVERKVNEGELVDMW